MRLGWFMLRVGLAMLQGARHEHAEALRGAAKELGIEVAVVECRRSEHVTPDLHALVLPGGESTTMRIASRYESLLEALFAWMTEHPDRPVLGTCAGAILLANPGDAHPPFVKATVQRNAWGRQRQSFEATLSVDLVTPEAGFKPVDAIQADRFDHRPLEVQSQAQPHDVDGYPGVFIRAPRFDPAGVNCTAAVHLGDEVVGVLDGTKLALTFHPELTLDRRFHRWLLHTAQGVEA